jgi:hypothetical protein
MLFTVCRVAHPVKKQKAFFSINAGNVLKIFLVFIVYVRTSKKYTGFSGVMKLAP